MSAHKIVNSQKTYLSPAKVFQLSRVQDQQNEVIEACCAHLPAGMKMEDKLLFVRMIQEILNTPTERCYKYANY